MEIRDASLKNIADVVVSLKRGDVLVFPTDTVYGLICDAKNPLAVQKIFKIKKREEGKPLPVFVSNITSAKSYAFISEKQEGFLKKAWPGKVTAVLNVRKTFPKGILSRDKKIGLRIPDNILIAALLKKFNGPIAQTSANISGKVASGKVKYVIGQFQGKRYRPDIFFNAGDLPESKSSTVIDLTSEPPKILRL